MRTLKMKILKKFALIILLISGSSLNAQDLSNSFYNYLMNPYNTSPAYTGKNGSINGVLNTKNYQNGISEAPKNTMFGVHGAINDRQGLGFKVLDDNRGVFDLNRYDLTYSYNLEVNDESKIHFGVSAGLVRRMMNASNIKNGELLNQNDPTLAGGYFDESNFIAGLGLIYSFKEFELSLSSPHLVEGNNDMSDYLFGRLSYNYQLENTKIELQPSLIYQNLPNQDNIFDALLRVEYSEKVWVQTSYQSTSNLNFGLGFDLGPFGVGYLYEMNNSELTNFSGGSNELLITLSFSKNNKPSETVQRLDGFVAKLNSLLQNNSNKGQIQLEIENIRKELNLLGETNNKKEAKEVNDRLLIIENQIGELEKRLK